MLKQKFVIVLTVLVGAIWLLAPLTPAAAAEAATQTLQVDAASHIVSPAQWLPVGDEPGHVIGLQQREGEGVFSNGETAVYSTVSTFDSRRAKGGTSTGYSKFTFADGSQIIFSWTSEFVREADGLQSNQGQGTIIKGTGRFEGIQGGSVFSGKQLKPVSEDPTVTLTQNATLTYTLP